MVHSRTMTVVDGRVNEAARGSENVILIQRLANASCIVIVCSAVYHGLQLTSSHTGYTTRAIVYIGQLMFGIANVGGVDTGEEVGGLVQSFFAPIPMLVFKSIIVRPNFTLGVFDISFHSRHHFGIGRQRSQLVLELYVVLLVEEAVNGSRPRLVCLNHCLDILARNHIHGRLVIEYRRVIRGGEDIGTRSLISCLVVIPKILWCEKREWKRRHTLEVKGVE